MNKSKLLSIFGILSVFAIFAESSSFAGDVEGIPEGTVFRFENDIVFAQSTKNIFISDGSVFLESGLLPADKPVCVITLHQSAQYAGRIQAGTELNMAFAARTVWSRFYDVGRVGRDKFRMRMNSFPFIRMGFLENKITDKQMVCYDEFPQRQFMSFFEVPIEYIDDYLNYRQEYELALRKQIANARADYSYPDEAELRKRLAGIIEF